MGTEEGMGKVPVSSVGSDDVLQVESKWPYLHRCEPWYQGIFVFYFYFFRVEFIFFKAWMRLIFLMSHFQVSKTSMSHFQVSQDFDESLSSLSRLG